MTGMANDVEMSFRLWRQRSGIFPDEKKERRVAIQKNRAGFGPIQPIQLEQFVRQFLGLKL